MSCGTWLLKCNPSSTAKLRIWTLRIWGFRGPGFRSARQVLCGDASRLFLDYFPKQLSSVLGRTELCHEVRNPAPQKPQIISTENHHLALLEILQCPCIARYSRTISAIPCQFLHNPREVAQIVGGQNAQSMRVKGWDLQKQRLELHMFSFLNGLRSQFWGAFELVPIAVTVAELIHLGDIHSLHFTVSPSITYGLPVVQMALQTENTYFQINHAFHSPDTDADKKPFGNIFRSRYRHSCSLQFWGGRIADENYFGHNFIDFIADTDADKYYVWIISAINFRQTVHALVLPLIHGSCSFLTSSWLLSRQPLCSASLSVHDVRFIITVHGLHTFNCLGCYMWQHMTFRALDGAIRANRFADSRESPDSRESFQSSRTEPLFCESRFEGPNIANRRLEAIYANRSHGMKIVFFSADRLAWIDYHRVANRRAVQVLRASQFTMCGSWFAHPWLFRMLQVAAHDVQNHKLLTLGAENHQLSAMGQIQLRRARFQTRSSVRFLPLTEFWGECSVSPSGQLIMCWSKLTKFAQLTEFGAVLTELSFRNCTKKPCPRFSQWGAASVIRAFSDNDRPRRSQEAPKLLTS